MNGKVLIVDDEPDIRELLEITLGRMSLQTTSAADVSSAKKILAQDNFSLCLTDMKLPDGDGIELVEHIQKYFEHIPVAVITAHGNTETAIKALKSGAFDFVSKPVDLYKLRDLVKSALRLSDSTATRAQKSPALTGPNVHPAITGKSSAIEMLREQIGKFARSQAPIFISGESGSGKELAARSIHQQSVRAQAPFIAVNCGALPSDLVESELFGHLKGSFTGAISDKQGLFQAAHGGTLFLDEIADLPLNTQVKLLRVIQERVVRPVGSQHEVNIDVRILSATHKNLAQAVEQGILRQDLYFRINVIELAVPSLRERVDDIEELSKTILIKIAKENNNSPCQLSHEALIALQAYHFPGNVRELENILQRSATLCENKLIVASNLDFISLPNSMSDLTTTPPLEVPPLKPVAMAPAASEQVTKSVNTSNTLHTPLIGAEFSLEKHLEGIERETIEKALTETRWNKTAAAKKLGMSFRSLRYRLKKLGLD